VLPKNFDISVLWRDKRVMCLDIALTWLIAGVSVSAIVFYGQHLTM